MRMDGTSGDARKKMAQRTEASEWTKDQDSEDDITIEGGGEKKRRHGCKKDTRSERRDKKSVRMDGTREDARKKARRRAETLCEKIGVPHCGSTLSLCFQSL